jgi:hypothetical protein
MTVYTQPAPRLEGRWLLAARVAWWATALATLAIWLASFSAYWLQLGRVTAAERTLFSYLPLFADASSEWMVDVLAMLIALSASLMSIALGAILFWRKPDERLAVYASLFLMGFGVISAGPLETLITALQPNWTVHVLILQYIFAMLGIVSLLFVFPNGRFIPAWTRWLFLGLIPWTLFFAFAIVPRIAASQLTPLSASIHFTWILTPLVAGVLAQIYRYRRVSSPAERQQTKWVVLGIAGWLLLDLAVAPMYAYLLSVPGNSLDARVTALSALVRLAVRANAVFIPLSLGIAVLRYHLWDVDVLIRRTLVYSLITVLLALVYFGGVVTLQYLFVVLTGQTQSQLVTVVSTLTIAALFFPLRQRVQNFIDRRFFRKKYDAAKTLADFAATARDETNLDKLTARLVQVVNETMQPESVQLWLRQDPKGLNGPRRRET